MNKRKIAWENSLSENKKMKMLNSAHSSTVAHITVVEKLSADCVNPTNGRKLNYQITDKTAKANLLKAANRNCFEIESKQKSTNLRFSAGSYLHVVMPVVKIWESKFKNDEVIKEGDLSIKVEEFDNGMELNAKHVDSKIVFSVNGEKAVLHCYNSTQNLMVNGKMYTELIEKYLQLVFIHKIEAIKLKIAEYDKVVVTSLTPKRPSRATKSVKGIKSIMSQVSYSCLKCSFTANNQAHIKTHKNAKHTKSFDKSFSLTSYVK